jgi:hypothetical protein
MTEPDPLRRAANAVTAAVRTEVRATVAVAASAMLLAVYLLACGAAPAVPLWLLTGGAGCLVALVGVAVWAAHQVVPERRAR